MEDENIKGQIVKAIANRYTVLCDGKKYICALSGKLKFASEVYVGDYVEVETSAYRTYIISRLHTRDSLLVRPFVANVDMLAIFISIMPPADLLLVDKLIVDAGRNGVEPIILINKCDLVGSDDFIIRIKRDYGTIVKIFAISCENGEVSNDFLSCIKGKLTALSGQSATGKTTLINLLLTESQKTGGLSSIDRGKHTTRHIEIFEKNDIRLVDTCGFSQLVFDMKPNELSGYYDDYTPYASECKYKNKCAHTVEPECKIRAMVESGELSKDRYYRYLELYAELKEKDDNKY